MGRRMTVQDKRRILADWGSVFPEMKPHGSTRLVRRNGPILVGVLLDRESSGESYRPTAHAHCLLSVDGFPSDRITLDLHVPLRTIRTGAVDRIPGTGHEQRWREAADRLARASMVDLRRELTCAEIVAAYRNCRESQSWARSLPRMLESMFLIAAYSGDEVLVESTRGYVFGDFVLQGDPDFNWRAARRQWRELRLFEMLFRHPTVAETFRGIDAEALEDRGFEWITPLTLDGELASLLVRGGAYVNFEGTAREAKALGAAFCEALCGERILEIEVYRSKLPWSKWFRDVASDSTFVVVDRQLQRIVVLAATDTD